MTTKELYKLIGKQFTLGRLPVLYTIEEITSSKVHLKTNLSSLPIKITLTQFLSAHEQGAFSYIGEPVSIVEEPVKEEGPANFFSLDDL